MAILHLDALPPRTTKGTLVRLLEQVGDVGRDRIGQIEIFGRRGTIEVPDRYADKLVAALDGASLGTQNIRVWRDARAATTNSSANSASSRAAADSGGSSTSQSESSRAATTRAASRSREDHFARLIRLLELEADADAARTLHTLTRLSPADAEQKGDSLVDLLIRDSDAGLGGRVLLTLGKRDLTKPLPWTRLGVGSPVLLSEQGVKSQEGWRAIISGRSYDSVQVALERAPDPQQDRPLFRVDLAGDEVARHRQRQALQRAAAAGGDRLSQLRGVLLGDKRPRWRTGVGAAVADEFVGAAGDAGESDEASAGASMNDSQRDAIEFALAAEDVAIVHGPPGTGKTTTVVELIRRMVAKERTVLACAPSNLAVDNLFERLLARGVNAVRLGHPARVMPQLRDRTLDLMVESHPDVRLARKLMRDAATLRDKAARRTRAKPEPGARRDAFDEARRMVDDARRIESQVVGHILDTSDVLCSTLTGLDSEILGQRRFDAAVIDEACQSPEPSCWIPLLRCERLVLAGDHCQLPPTVVSVEAARGGYGVSMMERLIDTHGPSIARRLTTQYRMHQAVMQFSSETFYEGSLVADESVREHVLAELPGVARNERTEWPLEFIDTAGAGYEEELEPDGESRRNPQEGELAARVVGSLLDAGVLPTQIALIAPYSAQVRWLRERLAIPELEIDSVDGFQGREKEAVVISLVRSNANGDIGFLADVRRMNVALTRARRKLIVIGDSATIGGHDFYSKLLAYFEQQAAYRTVWEETEW